MRLWLPLQMCALTFNVWFRLSEALYEDDVDAKNEIFAPFIERLILALYKHARVDTDHDGLLDDNDDFADFRAGLAECVKDVVYVIGTDRVLRGVLGVLQSLDQVTATWDETDAALFVVTAVARLVQP